MSELEERDRTLVLLARQAGFDADQIVDSGRVDRATLDELLAEDEKFAADWKRASDNQLQLEVVAANVIQRQIKDDPAAAMKYLLELETQRKLRRARELTTW